MSDYPDAIDTFREMENIPGQPYNADRPRTIYAEDFLQRSSAIVAIEATLGTNPEGEDATVAARLDRLEPPTDGYVAKAGDTMTGRLNIDLPVENTDFEALHVEGDAPVLVTLLQQGDGDLLRLSNLGGIVLQVYNDGLLDLPVGLAAGMVQTHLVTAGDADPATLEGNWEVDGSLTATQLELLNALTGANKGYRMRTNGSSLDFDAFGAAMIFACYDEDYESTPRYKMNMKINENTSQLIGDWEVSGTLFGAAHHWLGATPDANEARFNDDQVDADTIIKGVGDAALLFADASADRIGIGTATPSEKLTVQGNFNVRDAATPTKAYRFRTNGGNLDMDVGGAELHLSTYASPTYGGTQFTKFRLLASALSKFVGNWEFVQTPFGAAQVIVNQEIEVTTATRGVILKDRITGTRYRLKIESGVLGIEAA